MNKTILFGIMLLLLPLALALTDGQHLTQQQLDSVDSQSVDLECSINRDGTKIVGGIKYYYVNIGCFTIRPVYNLNEETNTTYLDYYQIYRDNHNVNLRVRDYQTCRGLYSQEKCDNYFINYLRRQHIFFKNLIRKKIYYYQSSDYDLEGFYTI